MRSVSPPRPERARARRLLALLGLSLLPWSVLATGDVVFAWGLATTDPIHVTTITDYLFVYTAGLPARLLAWPVAVLLYLLALASVAVGAVAPEDRRVTAGLLVLAGASHLRFSVGLARPGVLAVPTGTVLLWLAAWWFHWPDLRDAFRP
ncbi:TIGR04206 family protein [Halorussus halobius]|uniref:TIGR04206 family protein n=1 Tax=Halorussus halobius TaxID=1710537 RepID=UPI0010932BF0|nr:TIGR04206 family protein [Halorussus halobius]